MSYLAPAVLEKLLVQRVPTAVSVKDMTSATDLPSGEQETAAFEMVQCNQSAALGSQS